MKVDIGSGANGDPTADWRVDIHSAAMLDPYNGEEYAANIIADANDMYFLEDESVDEFVSRRCVGMHVMPVDEIIRTLKKNGTCKFKMWLTEYNTNRDEFEKIGEVEVILAEYYGDEDFDAESQAVVVNIKKTEEL